MNKWIKKFKYDPTIPLSQSSNLAIQYFYEKDILGKTSIDIKDIQQLKDPQSILRHQQTNGSWKYPTKKPGLVDYDQIETYRQLGFLVEKYGFTKKHKAIQKAAKYFFKYQTSLGDIRGIYGNQYSPNYTAAIIELLIKAGYQNDPKILKTLKWLIKSRQDDGGWALAFRTQGKGLEALKAKKTLEPDPTKSFSHFVTGIILRSFVNHPKYRSAPETKLAAELTLGRFFIADKYVDRKTPDFWKKFSYPFWQTDLLSNLDSLSILKFKPREENIQKALKWIEKQQTKNGLFKLHIVHGADKDLPLWLNLAICRVYKRFFNS